VTIFSSLTLKLRGLFARAATLRLGPLSRPVRQLQAVLLRRPQCTPQETRLVAHRLLGVREASFLRAGAAALAVLAAPSAFLVAVLAGGLVVVFVRAFVQGVVHLLGQVATMIAASLVWSMSARSSWNKSFQAASSLCQEWLQVTP